MIQSEIEVTFLKSYKSLLTALIELTGLSKSRIKKYYPKSSVLNKAIVAQKAYRLPLNLVNYLKVCPQYQGPEVDILLDDENFLILNKPPRIHSHPLSYCESDNLVSFVAEKFPALGMVNSENYDRGLIFRLDLETSGVQYYAKKTSVYRTLRDNFADMVQRKIYYAAVQGQIKNNTNFVDLYQQPVGAKKVIVNKAEGYPVQIQVEVVKYDESKDQTLVKVDLNEGRRHQIRAQLAFNGFPILGDELYGGRSAERIFLHCYQYVFSFEGRSYEVACEPNWRFPVL